MFKPNPNPKQAKMLENFMLQEEFNRLHEKIFSNINNWCTWAIIKFQVLGMQKTAAAVGAKPTLSKCGPASNQLCHRRLLIKMT
jgi:hypothetical protein